MRRVKSKAIIAAAVSFIAILSSSFAQAQFHIIPQPVKISAQKGSFLLTGNAVIGTDVQSRAVGLYLQNYLAQNYNLHLKLRVFEKIPATIAIKLISNNANDTDAYALNIKSTGISIVRGRRRCFLRCAIVNTNAACCCALTFNSRCNY
jgi:hexosaminidase